MASKTKWTSEQIQHAGMVFYQTRNVIETSRQVGIPKDTLYSYESTGNEAWERGKKQEATAVDKRLSKEFLRVTERAIELIHERLDNPATRSKLALRDISWMGAVYHDKRQVLEGKPTTISGSSKAAERKLKELSDIFLKGKAEPVNLFEVKKKNVS